MRVALLSATSTQYANLQMNTYVRYIVIALSSAAVIASLAGKPSNTTSQANPRALSIGPSYIVQAMSVEEAQTSVERVGGKVLRTLAIINGVEASLDTQAAALLEQDADIRLTSNHPVVSLAKRRSKKETTLASDTSQSADSSFRESSSTDTLEAEVEQGDADALLAEASAADTSGGESTPSLDLDFAHAPSLIGANDLHRSGVDGRGITIAFIDSGYWDVPGMNRTPEGEYRILAEHTVLPQTEFESMLSEYGAEVIIDEHGHGTHVTSIAASSEQIEDGRFMGVAPNANLVAVRAFNREGQGTYADVIAAIQWIVDNQRAFDIRVLNLSISAPVQSHYWDDPLNQAVSRAWQRGIVVIVSSGNKGPDPMTVGVPGNNPYVLTVGAMTDNYTPADPSDDVLASFSSVGPTAEGFVKPEITAPGGHLRGFMPSMTTIGMTYPEFRDGSYSHYAMSGTSQAAAVISGVAALMLQVDPGLSPDEVKCRIMASGKLAMDDSGVPAYSVFQQGAGLVSAYDAVYGSASGCANAGLNIKADLAGRQHFGGPANMDENGHFYIMDGEAEFGTPLGNEAFLWSNGFLWSNAFLWSNGFLWSNAFLWSNGFLWSNAFLWSNSYSLESVAQESTVEVAVNSWVDQE